MARAAPVPRRASKQLPVLAISPAYPRCMLLKSGSSPICYVHTIRSSILRKRPIAVPPHAMLLLGLSMAAVVGDVQALGGDGQRRVPEVVVHRAQVDLLVGHM